MCYNNKKSEVKTMQTVVDVNTMRESDRQTIDSGVSGRELMWRAATGVLEAHPWGRRTAIVCGMGNNAGDGFALALLLQANGKDCTVFTLSDRLSEDGGYYYEKCKENAVKIEKFGHKEDLRGFDTVVDCIFGTGCRGVAEGIFADAINAINASGATVISVDINSGMNGDSGLGAPCVRSSLTVAIGFYKYGHFLGNAKDVIGRLRCVDIGIPLFGRAAELVEREDLAPVFRTRLQNSHKGSYGYVSVLGGCASYAGAVKLANMSAAALRTGCGVSQLIVPQGLSASVSPYLLESTLATLPDRNGYAAYAPDALDAALRNQRALAIGMGWGRSDENFKILSHILRNYALSLVIDADAINCLSENDKSILKETRCCVVLTPHAKEMERLCGKPMGEILADPVGTAENFAREYGVILLLKGATTVVTDGDKTYLVNRGCAGMATAGSGDVLSGVLVGLLGYTPCTPLTVACGAYLAGRAGELAERDSNPISMTSSDTVAHLGAAVSEILAASKPL